MIIDGLIFMAALFFFAWYNAYSIKGRTVGKTWHVLQFVSVLLFLSTDFIKWPLVIYKNWQVNNFHDFGLQIAVFMIIFFTGVLIYVLTLRYFMKRLGDKK